MNNGMTRKYYRNQWLAQYFGADPGGFGRTNRPAQRRNFFEAIFVGRGAKFGEVNHLG